ncbi:MAG: hypothetical protein AXA67_09890 [Methylothermaceae bacteria B42]|nr:MAG: hypothetical protein AXA67_09890 [Methylothermaceae bacteria B42]
MRFGVDLGGTKIEIIALDEENQAVYRRRIATPKHDYQATLRAIAGLVEQAETEMGRKGQVGVGTPGTVSRKTGRMKNCNSVWLNDRALKEDLENLLQRPLRIANDADCFALSEASDGAAAGLPVVFGVILGTGVGGGIVVQDKLLQGPNGICGEWGHNPLPWPDNGEIPGPPCYCGLHGCIETFLSGSGLSNDFLKATGKQLSSEAIVTQAASGDLKCEKALQRYEHRLARALAHVINILDPDAIVLGGGLSQCQRWYQTVPRLWQRYVFSDRVDTQLLAPKFGDSSGVRGAAWLWG